MHFIRHQQELKWNVSGKHGERMLRGQIESQNIIEEKILKILLGIHLVIHPTIARAHTHRKSICKNKNSLFNDDEWIEPPYYWRIKGKNSKKRLLDSILYIV